MLPPSELAAAGGRLQYWGFSASLRSFASSDSLIASKLSGPSTSSLGAWAAKNSVSASRCTMDIRGSAASCIPRLRKRKRPNSIPTSSAAPSRAPSAIPTLAPMLRPDLDAEWMGVGEDAETTVG